LKLTAAPVLGLSINSANRKMAIVIGKNNDKAWDAGVPYFLFSDEMHISFP